MSYEITQDVFEGPLSLLVELAKLDLLDVFLIKLQDLTAHYLTVVKTGSSTLNELAEPLPLLGQLVAMKARLLLPQPPQVEEEEPPISLEELKARLAEYERFKSVAQVLAQLHALQHDYFTRNQPQELGGMSESRIETEPSTPEATRFAGKEVGLLDLMTAFAKVLDRAQAPVYEIEQEPWTVEMKVQEVKMLLNVRRQLAFTELFSSEKTKLELVVTFLALLELVRQRLCLAVQQRHFSEIVIIRREQNESIVHTK